MSEEGAESQQQQPPQANTSESEKTELLPQSSQDLQENSKYKNRLQEYTQKSAIQLPTYQTTNEGSQHAPRFRSTVLVDGSSYTSLSTFTHRKAAEQDVARVAMEGISQKIKIERCPVIHEDPIFCKSILNEYAVKMKLEKPTYSTIQTTALLPTFVSSCIFNGFTYTGNAGKNKKEAEQLAARAVILSILGDSNLGTVIAEITKSKYRLYNALHKVEDSENANNAIMPLFVNIETCSGHPRPAIPVHEFKKPKLEPAPELEPYSPILFVPPVMQQLFDVGSTSAINRNRKNKKKAKKKVQVDPELPVAVLPSSHVPPCSVAQ